MNNLSLNEFTLILSCCYLILLAGTLVWILRPAPWLRRISLYLIIVGAIGLASGLPFFTAKLFRETINETAIVMQDKLSAFSGPGEENARLFDLFEGMEIKVRQAEGGWSRVELENGLSGWIPDAGFESI
jgi:hypothetical protein